MLLISHLKNIPSHPPILGYVSKHLSNTDNFLKDTPPGFNLMPGMKVSGKIRVGKRRLITYFIYPLIRTLGNSFAEP